MQENENKVDHHIISDEHLMIKPEQLKAEFPLPAQQQAEIEHFRKTIANIIAGHDPRLLIICGPCSIHDSNAAIDYAHRLKSLSDRISDKLYLVMRVYFEKPRTTVGWKGLINDPDMDDSFNIEKGLKVARALLVELAKLGLPLATEVLNPNSPPYLEDMFSWSAIGARTSESQTHREIASGLSMPVGFKNSTSGCLSSAINAIRAVALPHRFISMSQAGSACISQTKGNPYGHIVLRGGEEPNYSPAEIAKCESEMMNAGLRPAIIVDCSHGNSYKNYCLQPIVVESVVAQVCNGNSSIVGLMIESNLNEGNQPPNRLRDEMAYGVSVTDGCISWEITEELLHQIHQTLNSKLTFRWFKKKEIETQTVVMSEDYV
ncbi:3-deoxy-7-phosphoheptulonate synthase [Xenorhabdus nematophila]|uniref:3-deoxy-7-phosphoheptulonate synthase n=1 Tax=Xenorhabdus nematophila TaxID=628 RepID=UPI000542AAE5|nr:3-deoxy-7-phosphoheptulonate synthase [Xenorhabdus nematophila]MBA0017894.1 3-deoxy-7-phosphoheptulonate synthase [Xenorhabdus nematophila]MCB4426394.1 3-deoxy-7-phosphoheptulonate synthase [Xenorhabdus nematophila]QNJ36959.1 3-deoxy-7-phosphoheptulonate synthase [Xenorhabdus nematophila]CEF29660.1 3-deoxy-D-arabino-heptulosonate-7-phosphate synthase, tyrosine-repressible [Xenorhabdus nematophila str. Websteri]